MNSEFVFPVRRNTEFGRAVHFPGSYLNLKRYALLAYDRCMKRLIHIWLRSRDIVLKSARQGSEHIVNYAEAVIAIYNAVNYYTYGVDVVYFCKIFVLHIHFAVNAVYALYSALNSRLFYNARDSLAYLIFHRLQKIKTRFAESF